jgi:autotransporter adhesin
VAVGESARATNTFTTAVGGESRATGPNSTAIGHGAQATASNSVALGAGSIADRPNTVSVGFPGGERIIANVAPGYFGTDAVNVNQLNAAIGPIWDVLDLHTSQIANHEVRIGRLEQDVAILREDVNELREDSFAGIAGVAALSGAYIDPAGPGQTGLGIGLGNFHGESAVALKLAHQFNLTPNSAIKKTVINAGAAMAGGDNNVYTVGIGWVWGANGTVSVPSTAEAPKAE